MAKQILVIGMHRSGTSMVAGVLHHLGVMMGENLVLGNMPEQPTGYYEDEDFIKLNDRILTEAGGSWKDIPNYDRLLDACYKMGDASEAMIKDRNSKYAVWGFKDPRLCLVLPAYLPYLDDYKLVVIKREITSVMKSLILREKWRIGEDEAEEIINTYNTYLLRNLRGQRFRMFYYEDMLKNNPVPRLVEYLGLSPTEEQIEAACNHIRPDLNRSAEKFDRRQKRLRQRINERHDYTGDISEIRKQIRYVTASCAKELARICPDSLELYRALDLMEEAMNKAEQALEHGEDD